MPSISTADNMEPVNEITTEAPPSTTDIMTAIHDVHEDVRGLKARLEQVEQIIETLPTVYATAEAMRKVTNSQADYEKSRRELTAQVAGLANVQADSQEKFTSIEARLNDLSTVKTTVDSMKASFNNLSDNITTFMQTQRERLDNQQVAITEVKAAAAVLSKDVTFVKTDLEDTRTRLNVQFTPLRDYVLGSPTQEGLKTTFNRVFSEVHELRSSVSQQSAEYAVIGEYVKAQKAAEENRRNFWQRVRLQMWTPKGLIAMLIVLVGIIMIVNAFSFDQLIARIQQVAGLYQALRSSK